MRLTLLSCHLLALALLTLLASCKLFDSTCEESDRTCLSSQLLAEGVGGKCVRDADCKIGLYCTDKACKPDGSTKRDEKCRITAECGDADYCGNLRVCQLAGAGPKGAKCRDTGGCKHGLVCEAPDLSQLGVLSLTKLADVSGECINGGDKEQGDPCESAVECLAGLQCAPLMSGSDETVCVSLPPTPMEIPALPQLWPGGTCPEVAESDPKQAYFDVPRGGKPLDEFYALPFPNDIRLEDGHIDMSGHAVAPDVYGLPFVSRYLEVAGEDLTGFSTNPIVLFRFSHAYDSKTVKCVQNGECNMKIVDITPGSPEYNQDASMEWKTITSGTVGHYICPHWLALHRPVGTPLRPGTTYAAVLTTGIHPVGGGSFSRGTDMNAMLAPNAPSNADLKTAYAAYEPLRAWADDTKQNVDGILNAAVFTTQLPDELVPKLREQIHADGVPTLSDLTVCTSKNTKSPCEDADGRGKCQAASPDFTEIHGHISLPIFQQGTPPYLNPEDGGSIELKNGDPVIQDHQEVCFAMSVPTAPAPAAGYPVLAFGHGTGGSFAGEMDSSGFAQTLAKGTTPSVLVAIDMPEHGSRRGDSTEDPESLFYNFLNPRAARDNVLQGSADLMSLVYWAMQGGLDAGASPTPQAIRFDTARIALMGHSQGSTHAALMAAYEPDVIGVVLSGNGGHLSTSMLTKTMPVDIASVVPFALLDPDDKLQLAGGIYNPALAVIQSVFDRADPVNYARRFYLEAPTDAPAGHHVFMTYGRGDTFAPEQTQAAFVRAGRLTEVLPGDDLGVPVASAPLQFNAVVGGVQRTIGMRMYDPKDGLDGHFVGVRKGQDGRVDVDRFLDQLLDGKPPTIGQ